MTKYVEIKENPFDGNFPREITFKVVWSGLVDAKDCDPVRAWESQEFLLFVAPWLLEPFGIDPIKSLIGFIKYIHSPVAFPKKLGRIKFKNCLTLVEEVLHGS